MSSKKELRAASQGKAVAAKKVVSSNPKKNALKRARDQEEEGSDSYDEDDEEEEEEEDRVQPATKRPARGNEVAAATTKSPYTNKQRVLIIASRGTYLSMGIMKVCVLLSCVFVCVEARKTRDVLSLMHI